MVKLNRRKFCECNCGRLVVENRRFISGHNGRIHPKPIPNHHPCECGKCGILVASNKRFIYGHQRIGSHHTEETLQKLRAPKSEEHKRKNREAQKLYSSQPGVREYRSRVAKETQNKPEVREKKIASLKITNAKPEVKERRSKAAKESHNKPEVRKRCSDSAKISQNRPEAKKLMSEQHKVIANDPKQKVAFGCLMKDLWQDPEYKARQSQIQKDLWQDPEYKARQSQIQKDLWQDPEYKAKQLALRNQPELKEKHSKAQKKLWQDPLYKEKQIIAVGNGLQIKPNRPETLIDIITYEYWTGWKYTGDYSVIINGKNPDFVNEGTKQIIEVYGDYWHHGEDPTDRAEIFSQAGYETCVIWESELSNLDHVICKLRRFMGDGIL